MNNKIIPLTCILIGLGCPILAHGEIPIEQTQESWSKSCKKCHGSDGAGKTKAGRKLRVKDYTDPAVQAEMTDEEMIKVTKEGVYKDGEELMEAYAEKYSEAEIIAFVAYIRSMKASN